MSRFLESICFEAGDYKLLTLHQKRVNETFGAFFPESSPLQLDKILPSIQDHKRKKVRVIYDNIQFTIDVQEYTPKAISKLKLVDAGELNYSYKFADRSLLNKMMEQKGTADDILIIQNGEITDSSYANVIFWDGSVWNTPKTCLLNGIKRQNLLQKGQIRETEINEKDLHQFSKIGLINAMLDPGEIILSINDVI